jgi:aldehyde dehydrogenase (NAD+)
MPSRLEIPKMYKLFIGGKFTRTESERYIEVFGANSKEKLCNISRASRKDVRNAAVAARAGFSAWNGKTGYERGQIFYRLAEMLEGRKEQFADEIRRSTGASEKESIKETEAAIDRAVFYAGFCDKWVQLSGTVNPVQQGYFNFSFPEATGVVGIILPATLSFLPLVSRVCAVLASGNSCIILANEKAPLPALSFSEVIATSDFPGGVINILTGHHDELIPHLAGHFDINAIDYCKSSPAERKLVRELCANNVKRYNELQTGKGKEWDWYDNSSNETLHDIQKFTEIKTVWHTVGN